MAEESRSLKLSYCLHGVQQAALRLARAHWHRPEEAFIAAGEGVSWAVALDVVLEESNDEGRNSRAYKRARGESDDGRVVIGMKFVRNHVHHAAELLDFVRLSAVVGNTEHGLRAGWSWAPMEDLEPRLDPQYVSGRGLYARCLAGELVEHTLLDANRWFGSLEPPIPDLPPDETGAIRPAFQLPERWPPVQRDRPL